MSDAVISAGVGLVVGLVPFAYRVRKDREQARHRKAAADAEAARLAKVEVERTAAEEKREVDQQRERRKAVAGTYLEMLGNVMALLDVLRVDAVNADDLLRHASEASAKLQGLAQGELLVTFGARSPVIWADRACRQIIRKAVDLAHDARHAGKDIEAAIETQNAIREMTAGGIDPVGGPRDLVRWAADTAVARWPDDLTTFEDHTYMARSVAVVAELELDPFLAQDS